MSKTWYIVMALQSWERKGCKLEGWRRCADDKRDCPLAIPCDLKEDGPDRWLAAFDDREKAEAWADGKTVVEVRIVE